MTKVEFDIPQEMLDKAAKKKISGLERKLKNAEIRETRLRVKIETAERVEKAAEETLAKVRQFVEDIWYTAGLDNTYERYPY